MTGDDGFASPLDFEDVTVIVRHEPIEVTRGGIFGGPGDPYRRFIPGPLIVTVELVDGRTYEIPAEHHQALQDLGRDSEAVAAFAVAHGTLIPS